MNYTPSKSSMLDSSNHITVFSSHVQNLAIPPGMNTNTGSEPSRSQTMPRTRKALPKPPTGNSPQRTASITSVSSVSASIQTTNSNTSRMTGNTQFSMGPLNVASYASIMPHGRIMDHNIHRKSFRSSFFGIRKTPLTVKDIDVPSGTHVRRLRPPFRFVPNLHYKEQSFHANEKSHLEPASNTTLERAILFQEFIEDEKTYAQDLIRIIKKIDSAIARQPETNTQILQLLKTSLQGMITVASDAEISLLRTPDNFGIVDNTENIERVYQTYMNQYQDILNGIDSLTKLCPRIALDLDGIIQDMRHPLKRLIGYRFYLRRILRIELPVSIPYVTARGSLPSFSYLVEHAYAIFGITDTFDQIAAWEDTLNIYECKPIGPESNDAQLANSRYAIFTHLTMPVDVSAIPLPITPTLHLFLEFTDLPLTLKDTILKVDKNSEIELTTKLSGTPFLIYLLTDTIVLTSLKDAFGHYNLLFPPMPLSHVEVVYRTNVKGPQKIFELKLSPFKMLVVRGDTADVQRFLDMFESLKPEMGSRVKSSITRHESVSASIKSESSDDSSSAAANKKLQKARLARLIQKLPASKDVAVERKEDALGSANESASLSKSTCVSQIVSRAALLSSDVLSSKYVRLGRKITTANPQMNITQAAAEFTCPLSAILLFHTLCRPNVYKPATRDWEKLSKCHMRIYTTHVKTWMTLSIEDTETLILTAVITPYWNCSVSGQRSVDISLVTHQGGIGRYLVLVKSMEIAQKAVKVVKSGIQQALWTLSTDLRDELLIQPPSTYPIVCMGSQSLATPLLSPMPEFHTQKGFEHDKCWLNQGDQKLVSLGAVRSTIITTFGTLSHPISAVSKHRVAYSVRLLLTSVIRPDIRLFSAELEDENMSFQSDGDAYTLVKVYFQNSMFEYRLSIKSNESAAFLEMLNEGVKTAKQHRKHATETIDTLREAWDKKIKDDQEQERLALETRLNEISMAVITSDIAAVQHATEDPTNATPSQVQQVAQETLSIENIQKELETEANVDHVPAESIVVKDQDFITESADLTRTTLLPSPDTKAESILNNQPSLLNTDDLNASVLREIPLLSNNDTPVCPTAEAPDLADLAEMFSSLSVEDLDKRKAKVTNSTKTDTTLAKDVLPDTLKQDKHISKSVSQACSINTQDSSKTKVTLQERPPPPKPGWTSPALKVETSTLPKTQTLPTQPIKSLASECIASKPSKIATKIKSAFGTNWSESSLTASNGVRKIRERFEINRSGSSPNPASNRCFNGSMNGSKSQIGSIGTRMSFTPTSVSTSGDVYKQQPAKEVMEYKQRHAMIKSQRMVICRENKEIMKQFARKVEENARLKIEEGEIGEHFKSTLGRKTGVMKWH
ncbi:hypothetical protein QVD99_006117 [Batrachochytrium dendrobatidis]|nr:hypothetical protein QVD99_006117 [Batrachochytrium dendrobatidis]